MKNDNEKLRNSRISKANSYTVNRAFMPSHSPTHSALSPTNAGITSQRGERRNSDAIKPLAIFKATRRDNLSTSQYVTQMDQMSDRSHMMSPTNKLTMSQTMAGAKRPLIKTAFAEKTNTSIMQVSQGFRLPK